MDPTKAIAMIFAALIVCLLVTPNAAESGRKLLQDDEEVPLSEFSCFEDDECSFLTTGVMDMACSQQVGYAHTCVQCGEFGTTCPEKASAAAGTNPSRAPAAAAAAGSAQPESGSAPGVCGFPHEVAKPCDASICAGCQTGADTLCDEDDEGGYFVKVYRPDDFSCRLVCREEWLEKEEDVLKLEDVIRRVPFYEEEVVRVPQIEFVEQKLQETVFEDAIVREFQLEDQKVVISVLQQVRVEELVWRKKEVEVVEYEEKEVTEQVFIAHEYQTVVRKVQVPKKVIKVIKVPVKVAKVVEVYKPQEVIIQVVRIIEKQVQVPRVVERVVQVPQQVFQRVRVAKQLERQIRLKEVKKEVKSRRIGATNCCICAPDYYQVWPSFDFSSTGSRTVHTRRSDGTSG